MVHRGKVQQVCIHFLNIQKLQFMNQFGSAKKLKLNFKNTNAVALQCNEFASYNGLFQEGEGSGLLKIIFVQLLKKPFNLINC